MDLIYLIVRLRSSLPPRPSIFIGYFFCDNEVPEQRSTSAFLKSCIMQLLQYKFKDKTIHHKMKSLSLQEFAYNGRNMFTSRLVEQTLSRLLRQLLATVPEDSYFLLDAVDEFEDQVSIYGILQTLTTDSACSKVKWVCTSRSRPYLPATAKIDAFSIDLEDEIHRRWVSVGVKTYIRHKVNDIFPSSIHAAFAKAEIAKRQEADRQDHTAITDFLNARAEDSFLWVSHAIRKVKQRPHNRGVLDEAELGRPDSQYSRIVKQILGTSNTASGDRSERVVNADGNSASLRMMLTVLCVVYRPLLLDELDVFLDLDSSSSLEPDAKPARQDTGRPSHRRQSAHELFDQCSWLLELRNGFVRFNHLSARDYLLDAANTDFEFDSVWGHNLLTLTSLLVLRKRSMGVETLKKPSSRVLGGIILRKQAAGALPQSTAFDDYACDFWVRHFRELEVCGKAVKDAVEDFLMSEEGETWFGSFRTKADLAAYPEFLPSSEVNDPKNSLSTLELNAQSRVEGICAALGLWTFLDEQWKVSTKAPDTERMSIFVTLAGANGHLDIVRLIFTHVEATKSLAIYGNDDALQILRFHAVHASVLNGHTNIIDFVLGQFRGDVSVPEAYASLVAYQGFAETLRYLYEVGLLTVNHHWDFETEWSNATSLLSREDEIHIGTVRRSGTLQLHYKSPLPQQDVPDPPQSKIPPDSQPRIDVVSTPETLLSTHSWVPTTPDWVLQALPVLAGVDHAVQGVVRSRNMTMYGLVDEVRAEVSSSSDSKVPLVDDHRLLMMKMCFWIGLNASVFAAWNQWLAYWCKSKSLLVQTSATILWWFSTTYSVFAVNFIAACACLYWLRSRGDKRTLAQVSATMFAFPLWSEVLFRGYRSRDVLDERGDKIRQREDSIRRNEGISALRRITKAICKDDSLILQDLIYGTERIMVGRDDHDKLYRPRPFKARLVGRFRSPLQAAVAGGHAAVVQVLFQSGLDRDSSEVQDCLRVVTEAENYNLIEVFLEAGVDPDSNFAHAELSKAHAYIDDSHQKILSASPDKVKDLLQKFEPYKAGLNHLYVMALRGNHWMVKLLLQHCSPSHSKRLWSLGLKVSFIPTLRSETPYKRPAAVVLCFELISQTFGALPPGWESYKASNGETFFANLAAIKPSTTWQDPRVPLSPEDAVESLYGDRGKPPEYVLRTDMDDYIENEYPITGADEEDDDDEYDEQDSGGASSSSVHSES